MRTTIRQQCLHARRSLSPDSRALKSQQIVDALWPLIRCCSTLGSYLAMPDEVDLMPLHDRCWATGIALMVPQIQSKTTFAWVRLSSPADLIEGPYGIKTSAHPEVNSWSTLDAILVPMVGFRADGARLGMGGGYYDRGLPTVRETTRVIGVAFDCQEAPGIDAQWWDVSMPCVITESRTLINSAWRCAPRSQPSKSR